MFEQSGVKKRGGIVFDEMEVRTSWTQLADYVKLILDFNQK